MADADPEVHHSEEEDDDDLGSDGEKFISYKGPTKGVTYPVSVIYCDVCDGWPLEYLEFHPNHEKGKIWIEENLSEKMQALYLSADDDGSGEHKKKRQTRGGRGVIKTKKKQEKPQRITLARASRGKKKFVTVITGLSTYDIDLKTASKYFAGVFACGSSVTGDDEIVIQGDCKDDLFDLLTEKWGQIDEDCIDDLGDQKRS
eukprot:GHVO01036870.1.p1 GENE.GHVO01036870.1~~GHVO01036870.1.p1  ORF type:complete len:202 (+),score=41.44 GHVO01036870.1:14-619(+)